MNDELVNKVLTKLAEEAKVVGVYDDSIQVLDKNERASVCAEAMQSPKGSHARMHYVSLKNLILCLKNLRQ
jgi:hypothetical protein